MRLGRLGFWVAALCATGTALAADAALSAGLTCESPLEPARIRCSLHISTGAETKVEWADALVVSAPSFALPLRARVPARLTAPNSEVDIPFGLVATSSGRGLLTVRARALVCGPRRPLAPRCRTVQREATLEVVVGREPAAI